MGVPGGLGERQDAKSVLFRDHMSGQVPKQLPTPLQARNHTDQDLELGIGK